MHGTIVVVLLYFAAREGLLGKQIKKIAVEMVKEKPPVKPKEPEKPKEPPKEEPPKIVAPKIVTAPIETPRPAVQAPPSMAPAAPAVAPAAVDVPSFAFDGGKAVESSSDPVELYRGFVEYWIRSRWDRPGDMDDHSFVAEVEVSIDGAGRISNPVWTKSSGDKRWDDSIRQTLARCQSVGRPPPKQFPGQMLVRFDVVEAEAITQ